MGATHFSGPVFAGGALVGPGFPSAGVGTSIPTADGQSFYVDSTRGSDSDHGLSPDHAFSTIQQALDAATSGAGDTIYVYPGSYAENLTVTKDYVAIIGALVGGYAKPDIGPASGVALTVTGQGFVVRHCRFFGASDVVKQYGNGFVYEDCVFDGDGNGATTALVRLLADDVNTKLTGSEGIIRACLFRGSGGLGLIFDTAAALVGVGVTDDLILGNKFIGNTGIDIATKDSGAGTYSVQRTDIVANIFATKNKTTYIDLTTENGGAAADQTGTITGNYFAADAITGTEVAMVGTGFTFIGNYTTVGVKDGSGLD